MFVNLHDWIYLCLLLSQKIPQNSVIVSINIFIVDTDQWIVDATNEAQQSDNEQNEQTAFDDDDEGEDVDGKSSISLHPIEMKARNFKHLCCPSIL